MGYGWNTSHPITISKRSIIFIYHYLHIVVVLCWLMSLVHLIPLQTTTTVAQLAPIFMSQIVRLHGLPETIVSDRDPKFTSQFWTETHCLLGIKLARSTAFHPQTNGASERMLRKVSQVLWAMVRPDQLDWPKHLPMVEFALNSSISQSTGFTPFELTYGYIPKTIQTIGESEFARVQDFTENVRNLIMRAHNAIIKSCVRQTHHANARHQPDDPWLKVGQQVCLSTENLNLPKAWAHKLMPKYIGPYEIISSDQDQSHYTLELPEELLKRRIYPTFHARLLRPARLFTWESGAHMWQNLKIFSASRVKNLKISYLKSQISYFNHAFVWQIWGSGG